MDKNVSLYINGNKVDLNSTLAIEFTYQTTDYENPTVIKNSFSKQVTIDGTPTNNNLFNQLWNLERVMDEDFTLFNPSQRVPFELYNGAELVEKGYVKLDSINRNGHKLAYNITLYGGLGSFFYSLSYQEGSDLEKTLADLNYMGGSNPDDEFDFEISKDTVKAAWDRLGMTPSNPTGSTSGSTNRGMFSKWDYINFIPAYNGIPEDFDASRILINTKDLDENLARYTSTSAYLSGQFPLTNGEGYGAKNGYLAGTTRRDMTEWEHRDLRSYLQRPALRVKGLINAISNPENNGAYAVELDNDFFNSSNPYYEKAWITMPMIDTVNAKDMYSSALTWTQGNSATTASTRTKLVKLEYPEQYNTVPNKIEITFELYMTPTASTAYTASEFYLSKDGGDDDDPYNVILTQFYINKTNTLNGHNSYTASNRLVFTSKYNGRYWKEFENYQNQMPDGSKNWEYHFGKFVNTGNGSFIWTNEDGTTDIKVVLDLEDVNFIPMLGYYSRWLGSNPARQGGRGWVNQTSGGTQVFCLWQDQPTNVFSQAKWDGTGSLRSFKDLKKADILSVEGTPCKWLLSYCKLFGLFIEKDKFENIVRIKMRNNWYKDEVVDLDKHIDHSQQYKINPLTFTTKWYSMAYGDRESQFLNKYRKKWKNDFGKQLINTNYNFDAESINLFKDNAYQNGITVLEKSNYFNKKVDPNGNIVPPFMYDWTEVKYFNTNLETTTRQVCLPGLCDITVLNEKTPDEFYDLIPKLQFHSGDGSPEDGDGVLCFFNGMVDIGNEPYWLSDDVDEMMLDGDNPCWLFTKTETNNDGTKVIAKRLSSIPEFNRYVLHSDCITADWDFGRTKELYVPYYKFDIDKTPTIYDNFWRSYINDLYDIDTRKVDIYVDLKTNSCADWMKKFYWWNNAIWVCTKINDYDVALNRSTLCSFTKVNDKANYLEQPTFDDWFFRFFRINGSGDIPWSGSSSELTATLQLDSSNLWAIVEPEMPFVSIISGQTSGTTSIGNQITVQFLPNMQDVKRSATYVAMNKDTFDALYLTLTQEACQKQKYLTLSTNSLSLPRNPLKSYAVNVNSSSNWTAYNRCGNWLHMYSSTGTSGTSVFTLSASTNSSTTVRSGNILFVNTDGLNVQLDITQAASSNVVVVQKGTPTREIPSSGGTLTYSVMSDTDWTLVPLYGCENYIECEYWNVRQEPTTGTDITLTFLENTDGWSKNAYFVVEYQDNNNETVAAYPDVKNPISIKGVPQYVNINSASRTVTVETNGRYNYTTSTMARWMSAGTQTVGELNIDVDSNVDDVRNSAMYINYLDEEGNYMEQIVYIVQNSDTAYLDVNPTSFTLDYRAATISVDVNSSSIVSGYTMPNWIVLRSIGVNAMVFDVLENNLNIARTGNIVLTNGDNETATIAITQGSSFSNEYVLDYSMTNDTFPASGSIETIIVRSDSNFEITEKE